MKCQKVPDTIKWQRIQNLMTDVRIRNDLDRAIPNPFVIFKENTKRGKYKDLSDELFTALYDHAKYDGYLWGEHDSLPLGTLIIKAVTECCTDEAINYLKCLLVYEPHNKPYVCFRADEIYKLYEREGSSNE